MQILAATLASMAENCLSLQTLKQIHAQAIGGNLFSHAIVRAKILRFAAVSPAGDLSYAHKLFDQIPEPNTFLYNTLIRGHSNSTNPCPSVCLFNRMRQKDIAPDGFTFTFLLKARSKMKMDLPLPANSDEIHGALLKFGFSKYLYVQNGLIHLYAHKGLPVASYKVFNEMVEKDVVSWSGLLLAHVKAGELESARQIFYEMPERDVVCWTTMVSGYYHAKLSREAVDLFWEMNEAGVQADEVTMVSVISACADLGDIRTGLEVHLYIDENHFGWMVSLCNALIIMYAKCGYFNGSWQVFNTMKRKSLITWNTMISACANYGVADNAFTLFGSMMSSGILPDGRTLLALLTVYKHNGWVEEGYKFFQNMSRDYCIQPTVEHYGCMVDLLGVAGLLEEACRLIENMPFPSNDVIWRSLLSACRMHGNMDITERVIKKLLELKPDEEGYYILLRDIYVAQGRATEANDIFNMMIDTGVSNESRLKLVDVQADNRNKMQMLGIDGAWQKESCIDADAKMSTALNVTVRLSD